MKPNILHILRDRAVPGFTNAFVILGPDSFTQLRVVATDHSGWDHVSVSIHHRCPTWEEMSYIKRMFFADDETAYQIHVPARDHIDCHPYCLHLWRPQREKIPLPGLIC